MCVPFFYGIAQHLFLSVQCSAREFLFRLRMLPNDKMDVRKCIHLELCKFDGHCAVCAECTCSTHTLTHSLIPTPIHCKTYWNHSNKSVELVALCLHLALHYILYTYIYIFVYKFKICEIGFSFHWMSLDHLNDSFIDL